MNYLVVAEKPSVAKSLAYFLSNQQPVAPQVFGIFKVYKFEGIIKGTTYNFVVTHAIGHLTNYTYKEQHIEPIQYFSAQIDAEFTPIGKEFVQLMKQLSKNQNKLVLCLDNDREGEHIGFEVVEAVSRWQRVSIYPSQLPRVRVGNSSIITAPGQFQACRMRFNAVNQHEILNAFSDLEPINQYQIEAVDVRMQLDIRIGFAMSSLQRRHEQTILAGLEQADIKRTQLTFGTCQTPTIGLVYYKDAESDVDTSSLQLFTSDGTYTSACELTEAAVSKAMRINSVFSQRPYVTVLSEESEFEEAPPKPLNTVSLQKRLSGSLSSKLTMRVAEKLYNMGYISYPRTETEVFEESFEFSKIIDSLKQCSVLPALEQYACRFQPVRHEFKGRSDHAHPPIHPIRMPKELSGEEKLVFETVCKAFLASFSKNCIKVTNSNAVITIQSVQFRSSETKIKDPGWREVYGEEADKIENCGGEKIEKVQFLTVVKQINAQEPKTEKRLIEKMDEYGIGTDATIAEHIQNVQDRRYVYSARNQLSLTSSGLKLVKFYEQTNITAVATSFRAGIEAGLRQIEAQEKPPNYVYEKCMEFAVQLFRDAQANIERIGRSGR